jgi:hypothetical protein
MYPSDLELLAGIAKRTSQGLIVQLSTYSANFDNSQEDVLPHVILLLKDCGLKIVARVSANGQMMSLVLAHNIEWSDYFRLIPPCFNSWLARAQNITLIDQRD